MKYIEVKVWTGLVDHNMPKGLFLHNSLLYHCQGNGVFPTMINSNGLDIKDIEEKSENNNQLSEQFILRLIAIGNKPSEVHKFTGRKSD
jgi:hypothetical protein